MPPVRDGKSGLLLIMVYDVIQKFSSVYTRLNMRRRSSAMAKQALFLPPNTILCSQAVPGAKTSVVVEIFSTISDEASLNIHTTNFKYR